MSAYRIRSALALCAIVALAMSASADAQEASDAPSTASAPKQHEWSHTGLLRGRDLSPFGLLRLDMLPARTAEAEADEWTLEVHYSYQNTFVLSDNVRRYLEGRNIGRQPLRTSDADAILDLSGDAFYIDGEMGLADLVIQHRLSSYWSAYLTVPYIHYGQGLFDGLIEEFHDAFGFSQQGRDLVARNHFQLVYRVGDIRFAQLNRDTDGGFGDPVVGVRYSLPEPKYGWDVVAELAAKIAVDGERFLLSTGRHDYGVQVTVQRHVGPTGRHALYLSGSAVYYAGGPETPGDEPEIIPTLIGGYSYGLTARTSAILQAYASRSVIRHSSVEELTDDKYQLSLGIQSRSSKVLWSIAVTENISNFSNTPDIGVQFGLVYLPEKTAE